MIAYLKGKIINKNTNFIIINTNDIGYKIFVGEQILYKYNSGDQIEVFTYQHIREDTLDLYGFLTQDELNLFEKLISISGVGPKTGLGAFAVASVSDIKSAIVNGDSSILKKVSGIGGKTADRIVLELKNKLDGIVGVNIKSSEDLNTHSDAIEALIGLGYSNNQAKEALEQVDKNIKDISEKIKIALKYLGK
jgi:holliday junction DNA helicase RuvA